MANSYVGEIIAVSYPTKTVPSGWLPCDGSVLQISQYESLFAAIGNTYGGDGLTTFQLPDLRSRVPVAAGALTGGGTYTTGQSLGIDWVTLSIAETGHAHPFMVAEGGANTSDPVSAQGRVVASLSGGDSDKIAIFAPYDPNNQVSLYNNNDDLSAIEVFYSGNQEGLNQDGHNNVQPVLGVSFIICAQGIPPF